MFGFFSSFLAPSVTHAASEPFLVTTGGRGLLAEEEQRLFKLRQEKEGEARRQLEEERRILEEEGRQSMEGKLCATPFGIDVVGITELIALAGAIVGGVAARQRKVELERLNEQLRKINLSLRQQARAGTIYAPGLTYAPPAGELQPSAAAVAAPPSSPAVIVPQAPAALTATAATPATKSSAKTLLSMDEEEMSVEQLQCRESLRSGKRLLRDKNGAAAMVRFEKALMLSKQQGDKVQERRAMRGLAASARLQSQYRSAIKHLERVLEISQELSEFTGDADAYGTIADCYTDLGEFEKAAENYDRYIDTMNREGPV